MGKTPSPRQTSGGICPFATRWRDTPWACVQGLCLGHLALCWWPVVGESASGWVDTWVSLAPSASTASPGLMFHGPRLSHVKPPPSLWHLRMGNQEIKAVFLPTVALSSLGVWGWCPRTAGWDKGSEIQSASRLDRGF